MKRNDPSAHERPVPDRPWPACAALSLLVCLAGLALWESAMRRLGLEPGDLGDGKSHWSVERRKVETAVADPVVIIGASRILFASDLALFEKMTGHRPIQLALHS